MQRRTRPARPRAAVLPQLRLKRQAGLLHRLCQHLRGENVLRAQAQRLVRTSQEQGPSGRGWRLARAGRQASTRSRAREPAGASAVDVRQASLRWPLPHAEGLHTLQPHPPPTRLPTRPNLVIVLNGGVEVAFQVVRVPQGRVRARLHGSRGAQAMGAHQRSVSNQRPAGQAPEGGG